MLSYLLIGMMLFLSQTPSVSDSCETDISDDQIQLESFIQNQLIDPLGLQEKSDIKNLAITAHVIVDENGDPSITFEQLSEELESLNRAFKGAGLSFEICFINYIQQPDFVNFDRSKERALSAYQEAGTINVFIPKRIRSNTGQNICGFTYYPAQARDYMVIASSCLKNESTLIHEMGHFFGLYHTHEHAFGYELANGANCTVAGDLICDTPADPGLRSSNVTEECVYVGLNFDAGKNYYYPPVNNFMSYSRKSCRMEFTAMQLAKMRLVYHLFRTHIKLLGTATESSHFYFFDGDSIDLEAKGGSFYRWNTGEAGKKIRIKPDSSTQVQVQIYTENQCEVVQSHSLIRVDQTIFKFPDLVCKGEVAEIKIKRLSSHQNILVREESSGQFLDMVDFDDSTFTFITTPLLSNTDFLVSSYYDRVHVTSWQKDLIRINVVPGTSFQNIKLPKQLEICADEVVELLIDNQSNAIRYVLLDQSGGQMREGSLRKGKQIVSFAADIKDEFVQFIFFDKCNIGSTARKVQIKARTEESLEDFLSSYISQLGSWGDSTISIGDGQLKIQKEGDFIRLRYMPTEGCEIEQLVRWSEQASLMIYSDLFSSSPLFTSSSISANKSLKFEVFNLFGERIDQDINIIVQGQNIFYIHDFLSSNSLGGNGIFLVRVSLDGELILRKLIIK
ncbi:MAG: hypothetical protein LAT68_12265 [Cyclobacteriaceae bacterium]|nr:hypothetical protein [Cyclobacteriaceae bacterium]MCH8517092.1 hypothetical protein [Cyclobacteriaceae bacterium]